MVDVNQKRTLRALSLKLNILCLLLTLFEWCNKQFYYNKKNRIQDENRIMWSNIRSCIDFCLYLAEQVGKLARTYLLFRIEFHANLEHSLCWEGGSLCRFFRGRKWYWSNQKNYFSWICPLKINLGTLNLV